VYCVLCDEFNFIQSAGLPANSGWLRLEDEPLKLWEEKGMQGWIKTYEKDMTNEKNTLIYTTASNLL
jgi:hypothetical protein